MRIVRSSQGFTLVEVMVALLLLGVVLTTGSMVFVAGQNLFALTSAQSDLQTNAGLTLQRVSFELQNSGRDASDALRVSIDDNAGTNSTDILRFAVPLCTCGTAITTTDGDVNHWGAPLIWGQNGCGEDYTIDSNNKVTVCHLPPGNPTNTSTLSVNVNALKAHLAHGDYIGECDACDPDSYTNKAIEYSIDADNQLIRKVLNASGTAINSVIMARQITGFQAAIDTTTDTVLLTIQVTGKGAQGRPMAITNSTKVLLRNR